MSGRSNQSFERVGGGMDEDGGMSAKQTSRTCLWVLLVLTLAGAWTAAGFAIAGWSLLENSGSPLTAGALAGGDAMSTASSALMEGVASSACAGVASCPAGDLSCALCKCSDSSAAASEPGPCPTVSCACSAILDGSGSCVAGADMQKCAICKLVPANACA